MAHLQLPPAQSSLIRLLLAIAGCGFALLLGGCGVPVDCFVRPGWGCGTKLESEAERRENEAIARERCPKEVYSYFNGGPIYTDGFLYGRSAGKSRSGRGWANPTTGIAIATELLESGFRFIETEKYPNDGLGANANTGERFFHALIHGKSADPRRYYRFSIAPMDGPLCTDYKRAIALSPDSAIWLTQAGLPRHACIGVELRDRPEARYWLVREKSDQGGSLAVRDSQSNVDHARIGPRRRDRSDMPAWEMYCQYLYDDLAGTIANQTLFASAGSVSAAKVRETEVSRDRIEVVPRQASVFSETDKAQQRPPVARMTSEVFPNVQSNLDDGLHIVGDHSLVIANDSENSTVKLYGYGALRRVKEIDGLVWVLGLVGRDEGWIKQVAYRPRFWILKLGRDGEIKSAELAEIPLELAAGQALDVDDFSVRARRLTLKASVYRVGIGMGTTHTLLKELVAEVGVR